MFYVGLDLGRQRDHTAVAVLEREEMLRPYGPSVFQRMLVRHLERVPLGTCYPEVISLVRGIVRDEQIRGKCVLVVDGTGVGAPVVDGLRAAQLGCEICSVIMTGGEREHQNGGSTWTVPKRDLIAGVQVLIEQGQLKIAEELLEAGALVRELLNMRISFVGHGGGSGRARMGADGFGEHDDLVIAVALGCWRAQRKQIGLGTQRIPGI
jgi:hypothetical protein